MENVVGNPREALWTTGDYTASIQVSIDRTCRVYHCPVVAHEHVLLAYKNLNIKNPQKLYGGGLIMWSKVLKKSTNIQM